ncbi:extracellular solute-binding protein [Marinobacter antarcticus]|uniref:Extracellular solute-binding protein n=3 Tax=root TaxID=1 RepID=A0A831R491_9GAMM|nr:extracellular solute-binding protein [Marinobacter antarcticus]HEA51754.1 extracellular solute-binding protein [Marinobacter antarcticus]
MAKPHFGRRQFLFGTAALAGATVLGVSAPARLLAARQQTLTLYNGQHKKTTAAVVNAFTKATGIHVDVRNGHSSQLANQIIEEGSRSPADVFYSEESPPVLTLANRSLLAPLKPETREQIPQQYRAEDGTWSGITARSRIVAYNTSMIGSDELPASVLDFATEAWKGRVAYVPTSGAFQEQIIAIKLLKGREAALKWLKGLKAYGEPYNGNMSALRAVEAGDVATALVNDYYWYALAEELGKDNLESAIFHQGHQDPGALVTLSAAGIVKTSKNMDAAQAFMAFMVNAEGQKAIVDSVAEYPLRPGVVSPYDLKPFDELGSPGVTATDLGDAADALVLEREAGLA